MNAWLPMLLIGLLSCAAWAWPQLFTPLGAAIVPALGVIMFGMGTGLSTEQLRGVLAQPRWLVVGVVLQFLLMPLLAWAIAAGLALPVMVAAGLIVTGACPGGTASNVMVYLVGGNLALSVAMTTCSTLIAPLATPLLAQLFIGERLSLPMLQMYTSILQVVVLPVTAGMLIRYRLPQVGVQLQRLMPWVAMVLVAMIVATIFALNHNRLAQVGPLLVVAVIAHNLAGLTLGYWVTALLGGDVQQRRTVALEVGMQNSGLASALAVKFLAPAAALPAALFSFFHNVSALVWIGIVGRHDQQRDRSVLAEQQ